MLNSPYDPEDTLDDTEVSKIREIAIDKLKVTYVYDGNFTTCLLCGINNIVCGAAKRNPKRDPRHNKETGEFVAFSNLIGADLTYAKRHTSRSDTLEVSY